MPAGKSPKPATMLKERQRVGLSQTAAAALIGRSLRVWQAYELGEREIDPVLWQVWRIRAGLAPVESVALCDEAPAHRPEMTRNKESNRTQTQALSAPLRILRQAQQAAALDCSRWTIRRIAATDPTYPKTREFSPGLFGVLSDEFEAWLKSRPIIDAGDSSKGRAHNS